MDKDIQALMKFQARVKRAPQRLTAELIQRAHRHAETLAGLTRAGTPVGELAGGRTRQSIRAFVELKDGEITGGVRSDYPNAVFQEFGTGPVAEAAGYPGETTAAHVTEGWWWHSGPEGQQIKAQRHGGDPQDYSPFTYTEGQPPRAMFYNAMEAYKDEILEDFEELALEVIRK